MNPRNMGLPNKQQIRSIITRNGWFTPYRKSPYIEPIVSRPLEPLRYGPYTPRPRKGLFKHGNTGRQK